MTEHLLITTKNSAARNFKQRHNCLFVYFRRHAHPRYDQWTQLKSTQQRITDAGVWHL